jgi:hypothetical protein
VLFPDHFVVVQGGVGSRRTIERAVHDLRPGVTEVYIHPAVDAPELRALADDWPGRVDDHELVTRDHSLRQMLDAHGVHRIGYRPLRDLQRAA